MAKSHANPPLKIPTWTERNEVNLLNAILEIANEPIESYDPRINLFDRINKNMEKSLTDREILDKIKELRMRFRKRCWKREFGTKAVKRTTAFAISEEIWGKGMDMKIEMERWKKKNAKSLKVNPQKDSRPNPKQGHAKKRNKAEPKKKCQPAGKKQKVKGSCFVCGNFGHFASDCSEKKIVKQLTKQQETKDISEGSVGLQIEIENKHEDLPGGSVFASLKVNQEEATSPNPTQEGTKKGSKAEPKKECQPAGKKQKACFVCGNFGHFAGDCTKKIAKQPTKQQESKDISKGCVGLQFETENKPMELSGGSVIASSQPGSVQLTSDQTKPSDETCDSSQPVAQQLASKKKDEDYIVHQPSLELRKKFNNLQHDDNQHTSEQTKQRDEMHDSSQPVAQEYISSQSIAHQPSSVQRTKFNNPQHGDNQHASEQRMKVPSSFKPSTYQHPSMQKKPFNRFRPSSHQQVSNQWNRESFRPPILTQPPHWGPPNPFVMPRPFTPNLVPYQYPPPPVYRQPPPPNSMNYTYYPSYPN